MPFLPNLAKHIPWFAITLWFGGIVSKAEPASAASVPVAAPGFVYRAEKEGRVIFLAASLHRMRNDSYPLPAAYELAYRQSERLWFEHDPREDENPRAGSETAKRGMMSRRQRVDNLLSESTRRLLRQHLASRRIDPESVQRMRPWYLGLHLMNLEYERHGIFQQYGIDRHYGRRASLDNKPVRGLETVARSIGTLEKLSAAEQDRNLADTLLSTGNVSTLYSSLIAAWRQGSEKHALRVLRPGGNTSRESWRSIVAARTSAWVSKLDNSDSGSRCMVLVGLDHLIGPEGMVSQFVALGYKVEAVRPPPKH